MQLLSTKAQEIVIYITCLIGYVKTPRNQYKNYQNELERFKRGYRSTCKNHQLLKMPAVRGRVQTRGWRCGIVALWPWPPFPGRMLRVGGVAVCVCCHHVSAPESWAIPGARGLMEDTAIHSPLGSKKKKKISASNDQFKMYWKKYLSLQENVKYLATSPIRNIQDIHGKTNENLLKPIKEYQIY